MGTSDIFKVVQYPVAPGICRTCGAPYGLRDLVDTGLTGDFCNRPHYNPITEEVDSKVDIELAGAVYICESCVVNLGEVIGMVSVTKADEMRMLIAQWEKLAEDQQTQILGMEKIINGYGDLGVASIINNPDTNQLTIDAEQETASVPDNSSVDSTGANLGESEIDESSNSKESSRISASDDNESGKRGDKSDSESSSTGNLLGF